MMMMMVTTATEAAHSANSQTSERVHTYFSPDVSLWLVEMSSTVLSDILSHDDLRPPSPAVYLSSGFKLNALSYLNDTSVQSFAARTVLVRFKVTLNIKTRHRVSIQHTVSK